MPLQHQTFCIERTYAARPERVYRAFASLEARMAWFVPPKGWTTRDRAMDFREGGSESVTSVEPGGRSHHFDAHFHELVPGRRLVFSYDMDMDGVRSSTSLTTVELEPSGKGTALRFTETVVFLRGEDGFASREEGSCGLLQQLDGHLEREAPHEFLTVRLFPVTPAQIFDAWSPERLARWWGPTGFSNEFEVCDLSPGGEWRFTMVGPDGARYPNLSRFQVVDPGGRVLLRHDCQPYFDSDFCFEATDGGTLVTWLGRFDSADTLRKIRGMIAEANEQNLDRLSAELARVG